MGEGVRRWREGENSFEFGERAEGVDEAGVFGAGLFETFLPCEGWK
jgi:hypothetical protein